MDKDRLKKLAEDERFIAGIYNYCDRWCERCPQTARCLNFSVSQEEFSDPETQDIRNEAFWRKLSEVFRDTLELLEESAKKWGIDLKSLDAGQEDEAALRNEEAAANHVVCRAARSYAAIVEDWFQKRGELFSFQRHLGLRRA